MYYMVYNKKSELHSGGWIVTVNNTVLSERGPLRFHLTLKHVHNSTTEKKPHTCQLVRFKSRFCVYSTNNKVVREAAGRRGRPRGGPAHPGFGELRGPFLVLQAIHPRGKGGGLNKTLQSLITLFCYASYEKMKHSQYKSCFIKVTFQ